MNFPTDERIRFLAIPCISFQSQLSVLAPKYHSEGEEELGRRTHLPHSHSACNPSDAVDSKRFFSSEPAKSSSKD